MTNTVAGPRGFSDETIIAKTGKSTEEWTAILDGWDAASKGHPAIARYLEHEYGVSGWWAQTLTVRYEYARGLRKDAVVPDDLQALLNENEHARQRFERLNAGHRREYIEWIIEAKRPETRARRLATTIDRLTSEPVDAPTDPHANPRTDLRMTRCDFAFPYRSTDHWLAFFARFLRPDRRGLRHVRANRRHDSRAG